MPAQDLRDITDDDALRAGDPSGGFDLTWHLAPAQTTRAGTHTLTLRWKSNQP